VDKQRLATDGKRRPWTGIDDYVAALARRRTARRQRELRARTQPENPRLFLSTLPFLLLIAALFVLGAAIMLAAWPGAWPERRPRAAVHELGKAEKGWFQEAQKDMHR
jgi:hypothetical protein